MKGGSAAVGRGESMGWEAGATTVGASSMLHASLLGAKKMEQSGVHKLAPTSWRGCAGAPRPHGTRHLPLKLLRSAAASTWSGDPRAALRGRRSWEGRGAAAVSGGVEAGVGCHRRAGRVGQGWAAAGEQGGWGRGAAACLPASTGSRQGPLAGAGLELRGLQACMHWPAAGPPTCPARLRSVTAGDRSPLLGLGGEQSARTHRRGWRCHAKGAGRRLGSLPTSWRAVEEGERVDGGRCGPQELAGQGRGPRWG